MDCFKISDDEDLSEKNNCVIICKSSELQLLDFPKQRNSLMLDSSSFINLAGNSISKCFREFVIDLLEEEICVYHKMLIKLHSMMILIIYI